MCRNVRATKGFEAEMIIAFGHDMEGFFQAKRSQRLHEFAPPAYPSGYGTRIVPRKIEESILSRCRFCPFSLFLLCISFAMQPATGKGSTKQLLCTSYIVPLLSAAVRDGFPLTHGPRVRSSSFPRPCQRASSRLNGSPAGASGRSKLGLRREF